MKAKNKEHKKPIRSFYLVSLICGIVLYIIYLIFWDVFPNIKTNTAFNRKPNIVIVIIDTLRADHCGLYGYKRRTTPNLRRIAAGGLILANHFVNSPWTKPSTASILSGLYPTAHGSRLGQFEDVEQVESPQVEILNPKVKTIAEILKANGYQTHAFITNYHLTPKFGYAQGFDHYYFDPDGAERRVVCRKDRELIEMAKKTLKNNSDRPVFIYCHLMAVHGYCYERKSDRFYAKKKSKIPINAKQSYIVKDYNSIEEAIAHYDNSILFADHLMGDLFDYILVYSPHTIFIVTSDHGEEFFEHGGFEHGYTLYNEILKVPCIIRGPGVPKGIFQGSSDSIDLMPTILTNLGIAVSEDLAGQVLYKKSNIYSKNDKIVFAEQHHRGEFKRFALIWQDKKMILSQHKESKNQIFEFYSNGRSIEKKNNVTDIDQKELNTYRKKIQYYRSLTTQYFNRKMGQYKYKKLTPKDIKHLKSLGYIQ